MEDQSLGEEAAIVPKKTKRPPVFAVVYDTEEGLKVEELPSRRDALSFVTQTGFERIRRVYKVSEIISVKTETKVRVSF